MTWRLAGSLIELRNQVDAAWPGRNKGSDGTIGDAAHQATQSDHNPDRNGVVCAFDITQDPAHGADMEALADAIRAHPHPAVQYLIFNRRIANADIGGFAWRPYNGTSPHTEHLHVSVRHGAIADNGTAWSLPNAPSPAPVPGPVLIPPFPGRILETGSKGSDVLMWQHRLFDRGWHRMTIDGDFGPITRDLTQQFQRQVHVVDDGKVGPITWPLAWTAPIT